jgi:hypothetical protein
VMSLSLATVPLLLVAILPVLYREPSTGRHP